MHYDRVSRALTEDAMFHQRLDPLQANRDAHAFRESLRACEPPVNIQVAAWRGGDE